MPPTKKTNEIPQEPCWRSLGLIRVFTFLNNNFDMWYKNNYDACIKAKEVANVTWNAQSTSNIVNSCIKAMKEHIRKGNKPNNCSTIIWDNKKLNGLIRKFCRKIIKREREEKQGTMKDCMHDNIENILRYDDFKYLFSFFFF
jgi:hypothetical protein